MQENNQNFNHLKIHTQYSICEGAIKIDDLKNFCKTNKIKSIGLSDTTNLCGALEFSEEISKAGTQPIIGTQINFKFNDEIGMIPLIAKNKKGYETILKLSSSSYLLNQSASLPYCDIENLHDKNCGLIILSGSLQALSGQLFQKNKLNGATHGDKVQVTLIDWPENSKSPFGKITKIIGKPGDHETEIHSILLEFDLPYRFEQEVEEDLKNISLNIDKKEISKRRDMRNDLTFTIDPKDAKDFDDALSFKILENGNFEIGIHIADVSHYVQPNTIIDKEAYHRATSIYLVDRVVPMLPEILSNGVCSLRPNEEKLTFSAVFEMNSKAEILSQWFGRTVIYSNNRFSYEEAQSIIENCSENTLKRYEIPKNISLSEALYFAEVPTIQAIIKLNNLAKILRKKRLDSGAISFDKAEVKFHLDNNAIPTGVYFKETKQANKLIEEFMLLTNKKVAEFIGKKDGKPSNKTFIYRVHDEPDIEKLSLLQNIVKNFGYKINIDTKESISKSLNQLLKDVHGKSEANMVETLTIRSMSKAIYTTENIGHYGLAFDYYSHFTSPIRRYPDVMTHRLLQQYLNGEKPAKKESYETKCKHVSIREELASKAERQSIKYMQIKFMEKQKNVEYQGVISGVTEWGIYVEINDNKCEGMVRIKDIKSDHYVFDEKQYALIGQSTKQIYELGECVKVKVKNTDLERKHLDFYLIEE